LVGRVQEGVDVSLVPQDPTITTIVRRKPYTLIITVFNTYSWAILDLRIALSSIGSSSFVNVTSSTLPSGFALSNGGITADRLAANTTVKLNLTFTVGAEGSLTINARTTALQDRPPIFFFGPPPAKVRGADLNSTTLNMVSRHN
jgi:hypothetical protein